MIRKNVKKAISFALAGVMVLSLAACGKQGSGGGLFGGGSNNKKQTDPMLAKVNVFRGTEVNLVDKENENIYAIGNVGGKLAAVTAYYDYANNKQGAFIKYLSENGSVTGTYEITAPDVSMYRPDNYEELINNSQNSGVDNGPNEPVLLDDMPVVDDDYYYDDYDRPSYDESFYYNNFMISDDGIIGVCEYYNYYEDTENGYMNNDVVMITKWDSTGNAVWTANMSDSLNMEYAYIGSACITNSGEIFAMVSGDGSTKMVFLNSDGSMKSSKSVDDLVNVNDVSTVFQLKSGKYVAFYYDQNYNNCASYFDPEKFSFEDKVEIPEQLKATGYNALIPGDTTEFIVSTSEGVYGFNLGDVELTKIMDYVNSDFDGYAINNLYFFNSNSFVGIYESAGDYTTKVAIFNYVDPSTIPDKEIVTVASYYLDSKIKSHIATFNKTNEKYRVMLKDYSKYATEDNYYEGTTKLNNEILAGDVPDIIIMNGYAIDLTPYAKKKMLVDFDELIQKDEELSKEKYLSNVFDAFGINGQHNVLVPSFSYRTYMASKKMIGGRTTWTVDEFMNFVDSLPQDTKVMPYLSREEFLNSFLSMNGKDYIDPISGKCNLNTEEFQAILEHSAKYPHNEDMWNNYEDDYYVDTQSAYRNGEYVLYQEYINTAYYMHYDNYNNFLGEGTLIGFPSSDGVGGVLEFSDLPMTIMKSGNVDGAWEFLRYFLTPEYQDSVEYGMPILESSFEKVLKAGSECPNWVDDDGNVYYYMDTYYVDGVENKIPAMTSADVEALSQTIRSCNKTTYYNEAIFKIIEEEASAFYSGQKSAKEVTDIMQSRVTLYINENS